MTAILICSVVVNVGLGVWIWFLWQRAGSLARENFILRDHLAGINRALFSAVLAGAGVWLVSKLFSKNEKTDPKNPAI